jgi:NAD(P)-dependent dehydrogenase (short-subunit alcohol dehydrogenase family)
MDLDGKVALVTGAGGGIGRATVKALVDAGTRVVVVERDEEKGQQAVDHAGGADVARFANADITDLADMQAAVQMAIDSWGRLDIACNNAGIGLTGPMVHEVKVEDFERVVRVNLIGTLVSMKAELPAMLAAGRGSIINVSSNLGVVAVAGQSAYVASKHGMIGLTKAAALEYAAQGVRVNSLLPGVVETPTITRLRDQAPDRIEQLVGRHPAGRFATVHEIADAVVWLASDRSSFVIGASIEVDGGYLAQ